MAQLLEKYRQHLVTNHCPTVEELSEAIGKTEAEVIAAIATLWEARKLSGIVWEEDGEPQIASDHDIAPEDVPTICEFLENR